MHMHLSSKPPPSQLNFSIAHIQLFQTSRNELFSWATSNWFCLPTRMSLAACAASLRLSIEKIMVNPWARYLLLRCHVSRWVIDIYITWYQALHLTQIIQLQLPRDRSRGPESQAMIIDYTSANSINTTTSATTTTSPSPSLLTWL